LNLRTKSYVDLFEVNNDLGNSMKPRANGSPENLATQEAEIRRIAVRSQLGQIVPEDPLLKIPNIKKGWWSGSDCIASASQV
jgi:hypothetical protein